VAKTGRSSSDGKILISIGIEPCPCPRPRVGRWGAYYPAKYVKWRKSFTDILRRVVEDHKIQTQTGLVKVHLTCLATKPKTSKLPCPRPDVDNFAKSVLDASNGVLWADDSLITDLSVIKAWSPPTCSPQIIIQIQPSSDTSRAKSAGRGTTQLDFQTATDSASAAGTMNPARSPLSQPHHKRYPPP
jgi:Holliday junction resolvase RusA-like endonuclease